MSLATTGEIETRAHLEIEWVFTSPLVRLSRYRCSAGQGRPLEQTQPWNVIAFPDHGAFEMAQAGPATVVDANSVLFLTAHVPYRTRHPAAGAGCDGGSGIVLSDTLLLDVIERRDAGVAERPQAPFVATQAPISSRGAMLERLLQRFAAQSGGADRVAVEETALALAAEAVAIPYRNRAPRTERESARRRRELVEAARLFLAERFRNVVSLDQVARGLGTSAYHLARCFKRQTGLTLHRYLTRLRLREALNRVDACRGELTELALDLGFSSHSHFSAAFRREFGVTPSRFGASPPSAAVLGRLARQLDREQPHAPR